MKSRAWSVVLHVHADSTVTVRVHVDTRILLPTCDSQSIDRAMAYVESILVDYRVDDRIALRAQGTAGSSRMLSASDPELALNWLRERGAELARALARPIQSTASEGARSGTRPTLRDQSASPEPGSAKKSVS